MWVTQDFGVTYSQVYIGEQYAIEAVYPHPRRDDLFLGVLSSSCCYQPCNDYCSADVRVVNCLNLLLFINNILSVLIVLITVGSLHWLRTARRHYCEKIRQHSSRHHHQLGQGRLWRLQRQLTLRHLRTHLESRSGTWPEKYFWRDLISYPEYAIIRDGEY